MIFYPYIMTDTISNQILTVKKIRQTILKLVEGLTEEQLNFIPEGFNNNIIWNVGHLIAAQQGICYLRAGQPPLVSMEFIENYKPGSKPSGPISKEKIDYIFAHFISTIEQLELDVTAKKFDNYSAWTSRYGVALNSMDEAIYFLPFHEGSHFGYLLALKRIQGIPSTL
ncbi:hypothetical protein PBAL39_17529 [Pedobacter sp. BAL39]|nr:hypothetical protein PBAL39_17529 [Pedobacter sp. BAL39]